ncbi:hypothetical protein DENIS_0761 [Desulfonema ishimotonii]|uniref:Uncharacterized protein n=1 Tax=Desulfonema ishimotonii TaxID=45657 RepID=A0A401FSA0_9BACT|nr:hypothetical protein [Desulfonema ishimotonii]GBC59820.1 hypothetical protein DENIS_0761 [Desulfonema ishimotonii]
MKKMVYGLVFFSAMLTASGMALADPMDSLIDEYEQAFKAVKPPPQSSVRSDYKFDQMAMSGLYTTRTLRLIYQQNQSLMERQDEMLNRYDQIIEQNKEVIRLLTRIAEAGKPGPPKP